MKLSDATILIGENSRYFSEVYKLFSFRDDQELKDYLDFILHEPAEWLKGFPAKLKTKNTLSRPKTVLVKLLKMGNVRDSLGEEYVESVKSAVWLAYKKNIDSILEKRSKKHTANVIQQLVEPTESLADAESILSEIEHVDETEAAPLPTPTHSCNSCAKLDHKLTVCRSVIQSLIQDYTYAAPGLANAAMILLHALQHS